MSLEEGLRIKLSERLGPVFFSDMKAHLDRDAVVLIASEVTLLEAAVAVARDDEATVRGWIESGKMRKPSRTERESWSKDEGRTWMAVVVQPFVLIQNPPQ